MALEVWAAVELVAAAAEERTWRRLYDIRDMTSIPPSNHAPRGL